MSLNHFGLIRSLMARNFLPPSHPLLPSGDVTNFKHNWSNICIGKANSGIRDNLIWEFHEGSFDHLLNTMCGHDGWKKLEAEQLHQESDRKEEENSNHKTNHTHADHLE